MIYVRCSSRRLIIFLLFSNGLICVVRVLAKNNAGIIPADRQRLAGNRAVSCLQQGIRAISHLDIQQQYRFAAVTNTLYK